MIPEFPLPTVDADFYKSQMYQLPPIFGSTVHTPRLSEPTLFSLNLSETVSKSFRSNCLENAVKRAAIRQRNLAKNVRSQFVARPNSVVGSLTAAVGRSLAITQ
ncbi:unnamed protein product [Caenorhabditis sp. 36 PRJEB53466]|nr:unnamed protein product [Caenorhabditis sp. 36 PRJEB53466]